MCGDVRFSGTPHNEMYKWYQELHGCHADMIVVESIQCRISHQLISFQFLVDGFYVHDGVYVQTIDYVPDDVYIDSTPLYVHANVYISSSMFYIHDIVYSVHIRSRHRRCCVRLPR